MRRRRERQRAAEAAMAAERNSAGIRESSFYFDHEYVRKRKVGKKELDMKNGTNDDKSMHPDRHHGIDLAVVSMFRGWMLVEAMALLKQNLSRLTIDSKFVGSTDLEELYPFALAMAGHLEEVSVAGGLTVKAARKRVEDVMRLVFDSATQIYGTLSRHALQAAQQLCAHYEADQDWRKMEPLLRQNLARLRQEAADAKEREEAAMALTTESLRSCAEMTMLLVLLECCQILRAESHRPLL